MPTHKVSFSIFVLSLFLIIKKLDFNIRSNIFLEKYETKIRLWEKIWFFKISQSFSPKKNCDVYDFSTSVPIVHSNKKILNPHGLLFNKTIFLQVVKSKNWEGFSGLNSKTKSYFEKMRKQSGFV